MQSEGGRVVPFPRRGEYRIPIWGMLLLVIGASLLAWAGIVAAIIHFGVGE